MRFKYLNSIKLKCQNSGLLFNYLSYYFKYIFSCCSNQNDTLPLITNSTSNSSKHKKMTLRAKLRLFYLAFFYNESNDSFQMIETAVQPFVGCFGECMRFLGIFLVMFIYSASSNLSFIFYTVIVPELWKTNLLNFIVQFLFGTMLVVNVFFHYTMGLITKPGDPPQAGVENIVSVCRKCLTPKPARTHHCSVCNKCVLKMDHHCPWFNNCIGFYNHRYFFLFVLYFTIALYYMSSFGFHYYQLYAYPSMDLNVLSILMVEGRVHEYKNEFPGQHFYYKLTTIEFFVAFVASFALTGFVGFNGWLISKGITNIEIKTIRIPCIKSTESYINPYDLGFVNNWKLFLGFDNFKTFFTRVILPSAHKPVGDGVNWYGYINFAPLKDKYENKIIEV